MRAKLREINLHPIGLAFILLLAFGLRIFGYDWDGLNHYHPDERYITWVGSTIEFDWDGALEAHKSSFNPYYWPEDADSEKLISPQAEERKFAYGHLPLYAGVLLSKGLAAAGQFFDLSNEPGDDLFRLLLKPEGLIEYDHLLVVGRVLTALVDTGSVLLVYLLSAHIFGRKSGLLAAFFQAVAVIAIQSAHFFIVDPYMVFFLLLSSYSLIRYLAAEKKSWFVLSAISWGLAVGCKFTSVFLVLPILLVLWLKHTNLRQLLLLFLVFGVIAVACFAVTNPYSMLDWTCEGVHPPDILGIDFSFIDLGMCYAENVFHQQKMASGSDSFPFTHQYEGTPAYLYQMAELFKWGIGPALTLAGLAALVYWLVNKLRKPMREWDIPVVFLLSWVLCYFGLTGGMFVKFLRYSLPLLPYMFILAAGMFHSIRNRRWRYGLALVIIIPSILYALAFISIYAEPHPWTAAKEWAKATIELHHIVDEKWDQAQLLSGTTQRVDWLGACGEYDTEGKLRANLELILNADYYVVASNRIYGVVAEQPELYPLSSKFYPLLFSGELGFELAYSNLRAPQLFGISMVPQRFAPEFLPMGDDLIQAWMPENALILPSADESFTVYDQPMIIVFENREHLEMEQVMEMFSIP